MTEYTECGARNCSRRPRPWSRYCRLHYERIKQAGGINGRVLRKHQLKPYQEIARGWVDKNRVHPSVSVAIEWMAEQLAPTDRARFLGAEWERLRAASVEPEDMLAAVLAVRLFDVCSAQPFDENGPLDVNTGRAILWCAPAAVTSVAKSGRKDSRRVQASHARALGEYVRETLGALPILAAQSMEAAVASAARPSAAIREGLLGSFGSTQEGGKMKTNEQVVEVLNQISNSIQDRFHHVALRLEERHRDSTFPPDHPVSFVAGGMERRALQQEQEHLKEISRDVDKALRMVGVREGLCIPVSPHDASQENGD